MKKFKELTEQHREKGRFHPVKPHNVASMAGVSPRQSSDSASVKLKEEKKDKYDEGEYDQEGDMAKSDLRSIMANSKKLHDMIEDADNLPEWCQNKITLAEDYISTVANYMTAEMSEEVVNEDKMDKQIIHHATTGMKPQHIAKKLNIPTEWDHQTMKHYKSGDSGIDFNDPRNTPRSTRFGEEVKTVTVKHKTSGKELVVSPEKAKQLKPQGYHPVKEAKEVGDEQISQETPAGLVKKGNKTVMVKPLNQEAKNEVSKVDVPAYLRKQKGEKPLTMADVKAPRKDSISAKENLAKARNEEVEQIEEGIEVKKEHNDKTEAEHGVYHNGKKIGYVVHHKPSGTHTAYHSPQDDDDYGQIDDFRSHHDAVNQIKHSAGVGVHEEVEQIDEKNVPTSPEKWAQAKSQAKAKFDVYPSAYANGWAAKKYKAMGGGWKSVSEATEPPFDKPYTTVKKVVTDKSGAKHSPMSRARDIARMALKKQTNLMKKAPIKEESRKAAIVKNIMKKKKNSEDAFQKDPELSTTISKI